MLALLHWANCLISLYYKTFPSHWTLFYDFGISGRPSQENTELAEPSRLGIINRAEQYRTEPHGIYM